MATWSEIQLEINAEQSPSGLDVVRRRKLAALHQLTGRNTIVYATDFMNPGKVKASGGEVSLDWTDKEGFIEVTNSLGRGALDVVIQSPGGMAEAAESVGEILREKFTNIRFIIPNIAKSAATMLAMSGNQIVMDERSELGPTDPQMQFNRDGQLITAPAHAIRDQFKMAKDDINENIQNLNAWLPILRQYGPSLLQQCKTSLDLSEKLVGTWLKKYMFSGQRPATAGRKAATVARYLSSRTHLTHSRRIGIQELQGKGLDILDMNTQPALKEAVWDLNLAISITFASSGAYKLFENHKGDALIRAVQLIPFPSRQPAGPPQPAIPPRVPPPTS